MTVTNKLDEYDRYYKNRNVFEFEVNFELIEDKNKKFKIKDILANNKKIRKYLPQINQLQIEILKLIQNEIH